MNGYGFFRVGPGKGHYGPAFRVGLSIFLPLLFLVLVGREDLAAYSVFGSLTGVYARTEPHWLRLKYQSWAGGLMIASVSCGVLLGQLGVGSWWLVLWCTVLAGVVSYVADVLGLRPTGPFFFLFAFSTSAAVPFPGRLWEAAVTVLASVAVVLAVGFSGRAWTRHREPESGLSGQSARVTPASRFKHAGRYVTAVALSGIAVTLLGLGHGYWAMVAACAPIAASDARGAIARGIHRIVGTYGGVLLAFVLLLLEWQHWQLVLLLSVLQFIGEIYVVRNYSLALVFMTPVALMMTEFVLPQDPFILVGDRALETTVGAAVAMVVVAVTRTRGGRVREPLLDET